MHCRSLDRFSEGIHQNDSPTSGLWETCSTLPPPMGRKKGRFADFGVLNIGPISYRQAVYPHFLKGKPSSTIFNHVQPCLTIKIHQFWGAPFSASGNGSLWIFGIRNGEAERTKHIYRDAAGKPGKQANRRRYVSCGLPWSSYSIICFFDKWTLWVRTPCLEP